MIRKMVRNLLIVLVGIVMLSSMSWGAEDSTRQTMEEFLLSVGIDITDDTVIEYVNVNNTEKYDLLGEENSKNAIQVRTEMPSGVIQEAIVLGLSESENEYLPVSFSQSDVTVYNTGQMNYPPSELSNVPIYLTLKTSYTTYDYRSEIVNPSGLSASYFLSGTEQVFVSALNCQFTVVGPPFKDGNVINTAPDGYPYDGSRTEYKLVHSFSALSPNTVYSAAKKFPDGYYIYLINPVLGNSSYTASGNVSTSSGAKSFSVRWSGL